MRYFLMIILITLILSVYASEAEVKDLRLNNGKLIEGAKYITYKYSRFIYIEDNHEEIARMDKVKSFKMGNEFYSRLTEGQYPKFGRLVNSKKINFYNKCNLDFVGSSKRMSGTYYLSKNDQEFEKITYFNRKAVNELINDDSVAIKSMNKAYRLETYSDLLILVASGVFIVGALSAPDDYGKLKNVAIISGAISLPSFYFKNKRNNQIEKTMKEYNK